MRLANFPTGACFAAGLCFAAPYARAQLIGAADNWLPHNSVEFEQLFSTEAAQAVAHGSNWQRVPMGTATVDMIMYMNDSAKTWVYIITNHMRENRQVCRGDSNVGG
jgi:hypothetical protein